MSKKRPLASLTLGFAENCGLPELPSPRALSRERERESCEINANLPELPFTLGLPRIGENPTRGLPASGERRERPRAARTERQRKGLQGESASQGIRETSGSSRLDRGTLSANCPAHPRAAAARH